ncbi:unnamed protein product [Camellia sinensis]
MSGYRFYQRASRTFHDYPSLSKLALLCTAFMYRFRNKISIPSIAFSFTAVQCGGGLLTLSDARPFHGAYADAIHTDQKKKRVVVLGTGWAGTSFLKNLKDSSYEVQVVSPRNYFAFTPLLPSVTNGTVEARSVVEPIRSIVRKKPFDVQLREAECLKIDAVNKKVYCRSTQDTNLGGEVEFTVDYDYLVIAMGARSNTFNTPGVEENCHFLKEVEDAQRIRRTIIDCFERATLPTISEEERKRILHFVVVGGGPTGVEFAAELHDFVIDDLAKLYPTVKDHVKITLLEAADHILNMFDKRITAFAEEKFQRDGIDLKTGSMVVKVTDKAISTKERATGENRSIPYGMIVWSTGIGTRPVIMDFMKQIGQTNRRVLATDEWLRVEGHDGIYALGDCATINQRKIMEDIMAIFSKADKNQSGTLTLADFNDVIKDICERYPQVEIYLKKKQLKNFVDILKNYQGNDQKEIIDIELFKAALSEVDAQMKSLPATAQVAAQQGAYLANCFNHMEECEKNPEGPLRFRGSGHHRFRPFRDNLLRWVENKRQLNFLGIGSQLVKAHSGFGIQCMQANKSAGAQGCWWYLTGEDGLFLEETRVESEATADA